MEDYKKLLPLNEYKLAQQAVSQLLAAEEQEAIRAEDRVEEAAIAAGATPLEETLIAIEVDYDSDALIEGIPLEDSDDSNEDGLD